MSTHVAVIGLGEAGCAIASDLAAQHLEVTAHDPAGVAGPAGVRVTDTAGEAVAGAEVVLTLVPGGASIDVATSVAPHLAAGALYGDCATAPPDIKRAAAAAIEPRARFADVALMGSVPGRGITVAALAAGPGAVELAAHLSRWGMPVTAVSDRTGDASTRKLLRSVVLKGLAAALDEALAGARSAASEAWLIDEIGAELERADAALVERLITGTRRHAARRVHEMEAASALLAEHDVDPVVTRATAHRLRQLAEAGDPGT